MNVTQNVITDLLPIYFSGEASPDTQHLIAEFLRQHPELLPVVEAQKRQFGQQHELLAAGAPSPGHELRTLVRTRSLMERLKWQLALALMLTVFPLSFAFNGSHVTFFMVRDQPLLAIASWTGAAILWSLHFLTRRRLREKGI